MMLWLRRMTKSQGMEFKLCLLKLHQTSDTFLHSIPHKGFPHAIYFSSHLHPHIFFNRHILPLGLSAWERKLGEFNQGGDEVEPLWSAIDPFRLVNPNKWPSRWDFVGTIASVLLLEKAQHKSFLSVAQLLRKKKKSSHNSNNEHCK